MSREKQKNRMEFNPTNNGERRGLIKGEHIKTNGEENRVKVKAKAGWFLSS
jgi:hypothetical protein